MGYQISTYHFPQLGSPLQYAAMSGTKTALVLTLISLLPISANRIIALEKAGIHVADRHLFVNYDYRPFDAENWSPLPSVLLGPARLQLVRQAYRLILRRR